MMVFIARGVAGGIDGMKATVRLSRRKGALTRVFAGALFAAAAFMLSPNAGALGVF